MGIRYIRPIRVFVADCNADSRNVLLSLLSADDRLNVLGGSGSGTEAFESIVALRPDVLVTDMILPGLDGFALVHDVRKRLGEDAPAVIMLSEYTNTVVVREVMAESVDYFMLKPVPTARLIERICDAVIAQKDDGNDLIANITQVLLEIGVPAHLRGYQYVREAIALTVADPSVLDSVTKYLYPAVANTYSTTNAKVERAIRHAIEVAWERGSMDEMQKIFGYSVSAIKGKPTNSEFVATIADYLSINTKTSSGERVYSVR